MIQSASAMAIAIRALEARTTLQRLTGERYPVVCQPYRDLLCEVTKAYGWTLVEALHELLKTKPDALCVMWLCAAFAEEAEG